MQIFGRDPEVFHLPISIFHFPLETKRKMANSFLLPEGPLVRGEVPERA
jgi:hypothetical protein